jgi:hypothetical protein
VVCHDSILPSKRWSLHETQGESLWANLKGVELANFAGDTVVEVADAASQGVRRVCDDQQLVWSFLAHTGLPFDHHPPLNL